MENEFNDWNKFKINLQKSYKKVFFHEREIWFCALGKNIGSEEDGKNENFERPVLILRKFNNDIFLGFPLTSQEKEGVFYFELDYEIKSNIILSQIRLLDQKRLMRKIRTIYKQEFKEIIKKFTDLLPK